MKYEVEKLPKKTVKITITVPADEVRQIKSEAVNDLAREVEVPGFRKGSVPRELAEPRLDKGKIRGEIVNRAVNKYYAQVIKESLLNPIVYPRLEIKEFEEEKDLIITVSLCEKPEIEISSYTEAIRNLALKSRDIKTSGLVGADGNAIENTGDTDGNSEINRILDAVLESAKIGIPDLLTDEEVNHMLSRLVDQTSRLGLTVEQYLVSNGKTVEQLKEEYKAVAEKNLKMEFILLEIAQKENIAVTDEEISATIMVAPDEQSRKVLGSEENKNYVKAVILKNKVVQHLVKIYEEGKNRDTIKTS